MLESLGQPAINRYLDYRLFTLITFAMGPVATLRALPGDSHGPLVGTEHIWLIFLVLHYQKASGLFIRKVHV